MPTRTKSARPPWLWIGAAAVVVLAAVIAVVGTRDTGSSPTTAGDLAQTRAVTVDGEPLPALPDSGADPALGLVAPELHGESFDGSPVAVTHDGRPKLVLFVAHWCPHCQREVPLIAQHLTDNPLPAGIDLVTVATSTSANQPNFPPSSWLAAIPWTTPTMADSDTFDAAVAFGLKAFPYFVALDADGKVVARTTGEISTDDFDAIVAKALARG